MGSWIAEGHRLLDRLESLPVPVVAVVNGYALGGGLELALACDFIYATENARFGQTEAKLGFVSGWGGARRLSRRIGTARAKELFYTGRIIEPSEAFSLGLVNFVGDAEAVEARLIETVEAIEGASRTSVRELKLILTDPGERQAGLASAMAEAIASQSCIADADTKRRLSDFLSGRR
jgi:enoyl-CoA hydratase